MLERFFSWLDRALRTGPAPHVPALAAEPISQPLAVVTSALPAAPPLGATALVSVDDAGQFLLVGAERVTFGHLRAARADLVFLADVGALHAELVREDSLREGPGWRLLPLAGEPVTLEGRALGPDGARLASGERVRLGSNLEFVFRVPDPASASALLELAHGAECLGARRILLFVPGPAGRIALGPQPRHALRVAGLEFVLRLERTEHELVLEGEAGPAAGALAGAQRVPFPPPARLTFSTGTARGSRPPFSWSLEPVARPGAVR